jgi:hypothetical protein
MTTISEGQEQLETGLFSQNLRTAVKTVETVEIFNL